jgi:hypothetical protein
MKKHALVLGFVCLVLPLVAFAQQARKADNQYAVLTYMRVPAENIAEYTEILRNNSKKVFTELMNQPGSNLWAWSSAQMTYSGTHGGEANFVAASVYDGPPPNPNDAALDAATRKVTGQDPVEYRKKLNTLRTVVGSELIRGVAAARGSSQEGYYRVTTYAKLTPQKGAAYRAQTAAVWQPVYESLVKDGTIVSWGAWQYVFPRGAETPYDLVNSTTYKDLPSAVKGIESMSQIFLKVHPDQNMVSAVDESRSNSKVVRTVLARIVAMAQKQ